MKSCGPSDDDYQAQNDFDTMSRAAEVQASPTRHKAARAFGTKKVGHMVSALGDPAQTGKQPSDTRVPSNKRGFSAKGMK